MPDERDPPQYSLFKVEEQAAVEPPRATASSKFSDFIVYVDESGDHSMERPDPSYPMFVLAFCVFYKRNYAEQVVPALEKFKFNHFGHDLVVLHEHEIRKETGAFRFESRKAKDDFLGELTSIIGRSNFILISCVINKEALKRAGGVPPNPYNLALSFCLESLHELMDEKKQGARKTHVVFERRGEKEDKELELEFRRICDGANRRGGALPFTIIFGDKRVNSGGLQLADLVARPIGLSVLRPAQPNRAFEILKAKFFCDGGRSNVGNDYEGRGLKVLPAPESEKPR
ncbi:MAG: DUF3800 domain-containing protein [Archangium sp.]|nr:DUF3800 domain-containing protein [Archangium sp.]